MQRRFAVSLVIAAVSLIGAGCSKKTQHLAANPAPQLQQGPAWSLALKSTCNAAADEECVAKHGFIISADRKFEVGPGPNGQMLKGEISEEEMKQLEAALKDATSPALVPPSAESCREVGADAEPAASLDTLVLTKASVQSTILRTEEARVCNQSANEESAHKLHAAMRALADKYYRLPFPDACSDTVTQLHDMYATLQTCSIDADCAYVTHDTFDVVPSSSSQYIITDSCSLVNPMVVGNANALVAHQAQLSAALDQAQASCGARIMRNDCVGVTGFDSSVGAPSCQQGVCRANANAHSFR